MGLFVGFVIGFMLSEVCGNAVADVLGGIIGKDVIGSRLLKDMAENILGLAGLGFGVSGMQWLVMRRRVSRAGWWVLANTAGFALAIGGGTYFDVSEKLLRILTVVLPLAGAVTGGVLVWLLRKPLTEAKVERIRIGWGFWLQWVLASTIGSFLGFCLGFLLFEVLDQGWIMFGAGFGSMVGVLQWLFLKVQFSRAGRWVFASTVGFALAFGVGGYFEVLGSSASTVQSVSGWTVVVILGGAVTGILQWLVLRGQVSSAGLWVLASTVGWGLGMAVWGAFSPVGEGLPVAGLVMGAVTGGVLVWLLRQPLPEA
jgi:hypothetical protein